MESAEKLKEIEYTCSRCGHQAYESDVEGYPAVCLDCDENMFLFELIPIKTKS